jgi:hypothetical protein
MKTDLVLVAIMQRRCHAKAIDNSRNSARRVVRRIIPLAGGPNQLETRAWIDAQNAYTRSQLDRCPLASG